jgi:hypothetical protein
LQKGVNRFAAMTAKVMTLMHEVLFYTLFTTVIAACFLFGLGHKKSVSANVTRFLFWLCDKDQSLITLSSVF